MVVTETQPAQRREQQPAAPALEVVGLFAGIGGIEQGLGRAGHTTNLLCELDEAAAAVLGERFPQTPLVRDVRDIDSLPEADLVAAGFPCQDLSQAGRTAGIRGRNSGLVTRVFELVENAARAGEVRPQRGYAIVVIKVRCGNDSVRVWPGVADDDVHAGAERPKGSCNGFPTRVCSHRSPLTTLNRISRTAKGGYA